MTVAQIEIQLIAALVAAACAIPGVFLVLRKMALVSDAISHSILPGVVIGFFITHNLNSPLLIIIAAITGVLTVMLVELIYKTNLVKEDTAIGLVFPALFSLGVIMISKKAANIHIDTDAVLVGELAFAPFDRLNLFNMDLGPKALWVMGIILIINIVFFVVFFKELKLSTFDAGLAASLGISPVFMHYMLMSLVSVTTVGAFDAVGAILVVGFMIVPASTAYLLTDDLIDMIFYSAGIGIVASISGYWLANILDASIAGSIATMLGLIFFFTYLFATERGIVAVMRRRKRQKQEFNQLTLVAHVYNHAGKEEALEENNMNHFSGHFNWNEITAKETVFLAKQNDLVYVETNLIYLTEKGRRFAEEGLKMLQFNADIDSDLKSQFMIFND
jgi:manganese/zinc/iron transport system permease protein